jgi:hypothetical protein
VFKRYRANYAIWPELARPRHGRPARFAIGSFALGVICAAAYGVVFDFSGPVSGHEIAARSNLERGPVYASVPPAAPPAPAPTDSENRSRPRAPAAKAKLPIIGARTAMVSTGPEANVGDALTGERPAANAAGPANPPTAKKDDDALPRAIPVPVPAPEARPEPAPATEPAERPDKPRNLTVAERRDEPAIVARDARAPERVVAAPAPKPERATAKPVRETPAQETRSDRPASAELAKRHANARRNLLRKKSEEPARVVREESEPVREMPARQARAAEAKRPAEATPSASIARRAKRERPVKVAEKSGPSREAPVRRTARQRRDLSSITSMAVQALRMVTGSGMMGTDGGGF